MRSELQHLVDWHPLGVIGGFRITEHPRDPLQDRIEAWPAAAVAKRLSEARSKSIKSIECKEQWAVVAAG